jgi:membrane-bound inhibitor of C-type lysozyme
MKRLSIAAFALLTASVAACVQEQQPVTNLIPRPSPEDPTPAGISYLCDGRKEVTVVYAKNRASVTFGDKTWRMEYQPTGDGFRYTDTVNEWTGRDDLATLREFAPGAKPLAFNCRPLKRTV